MLRDSRAIIARLERDGFRLVSVSGSHHKFRNADGRMVNSPSAKGYSTRDSALDLQASRRAEGLTLANAHYIALIHKEPDSGYGVSFPDVPGVTTAADSLDDALVQAADVLRFAFEDWAGERPLPRSIDELRADPVFVADSADAVVVAVRPGAAVFAAAE
jgi:predicted RNase H-like HicB family nuclease